MNWNSAVPLLVFGDYSELYAEESRGRVISFEDGKVDEVESGESSGLALRYLEGEETRFGHADGLDFGPAAQLAKGLSEGLKKRAAVSPAHSIQTSRHAIRIDPFSIPLDEKVRLLTEADRAARQIPEGGNIRQVSLTYGERFKRISLLGVEEAGGARAFIEERVYMVFSVTVVAESGGILQTATEVAGALTGFELFEKYPPVEIALAAAKRAVQKLKSPPAPTGEMPVVLEAQAGGTMIHEAIGHSLEADGIQKGISPAYSGKIGSVVANEKITVYDDPTLSGRRGSFVYDDEGTCSESTVLVEKGVLKTYLYDRLTAKKDGRQSNGHGRRESYSHKPIPRMSNTFIAPGPDDPEKIVGSVSNGLLVRRMGGGQVNPVTGDFVFEVEEGYLLKDGKIFTMVRGASLLGNGPQVLSSIDLVGSDMGWGVGTCGKGGQGVPVSDGQPTLRIPKLLIGGTQG